MNDAQSQAEMDRKQGAAHGGAGALPDRPQGKSLAPLAMLWPYALRHKAIFWPAILLLLLGVGLTLSLSFLARNIVDEGLAVSDVEAINQGFLVFLTIVVALAIVSSARFYFMSLLGERAAADIRADVFERLITLSQRYYAQVRTGEAVSRLTADVTLIESFLGSSASIAMRNSLTLVGALIMMFILNWKLTLILIVIALTVMTPIGIVAKQVRKLSTGVQDRIADAASEASESLESIELVHAYGQEKTRAQRFRDACEIAFQAARKRIWMQTLLSGLFILGIFAGVAVIIWLSIQDVLNGRMTAGDLTQFTMLAMQGVSGFGMLGEVFNAAMRTSGAIQRCAEILDETPDIAAPPNPVALPSRVRGAVSFRNVSFSYPHEAATGPALSSFDLDVKPEETVALVGPSGAGKSTVFRLLLRFYDPDQGTVMLDAVDARATAPSDWRRQFGYVPQEAILFSGTAADNLRFAAPDADEDEIRAALEQAEAWRFLKDKQGLQSQLGGRGKSLSGGERQRIAIARALVRNTPVMLLDEATSALDAENEHLIQKALEKASSGRTTFIIAHRLATVRRADRIIVMEKGSVVEEGDHESLVNAGGLYSRLADLQFVSS